MKIVICGNYGAKNIGDEMILEGLIALINKVSPNAKITVLSADPKETSDRYKVQSAPKFPAGLRSMLKGCGETKKIVRECDLFILGGGGLFGNLTFRANFIWGVQAIMAYRYGKKVMMLGQSIGKINGFFQRKLVKYIFNKASLISVRDYPSKKRLQKLKVRKKILVSPDLALYESQSKNSNQIHQLTVALRHLPNQKPELYKNIADFLDWVIEKQNWEVTMINFQEPDDEIINQHVLNKMKHKDRVIYPGTIDQFHSSKVILGMRLHSIIKAVKEQIPFIAINYASKVEDFLKYAGLQKQITPTHTQELKEKFLEITKNYREEKEKIDEFLNKLRPEFRKLERNIKPKLPKL